MIYPTIILDNFFNDPLKLVKYANSLEYNEHPTGEWPGKRTVGLYEINKSFFNQYGSKIMKVLYPTVNHVSFTCSLYFQKISKEYVNKGWVHKDFDFTTILYLSQHKECGTSIFDPKDISAEILNNEDKKNTYIKKDFKQETKYLNENNNQFIETVKINSKFNRLIMFDGAQFHAAQKFIENDIEEDRLILVGFYKEIHFQGIKFNGVEHKRII